jgi:hypothetical protein
MPTFLGEDLRNIVIFSLIAIVLALIIDYAFQAVDGLRDAAGTLVWGLIRMYTPTAAALIVGGPSMLKKYLRIDGRVAIVYLAAPFITFAALSIYLAILLCAGAFTTRKIVSLLSIPSIDFPAFMALTLLNGYIASLTLNAVFALGEEIGWRGYLLDRFQSIGMGLAKSSIFVGAIWGAWHASAIILLGHNYPDNRFAGVFLFVVFTISAALPHAFVRNISSSVLPAASLHGSINAVWGLTILTTELPREVAGLGPIAYASWTATSLAIYLVVIRGGVSGMRPRGPC